MTKETLAAQLNGREYGAEIAPAEGKEAKIAGLVILFGGSDDLAEFRGAIFDETECYGGCELLITKDGLLDSGHAGECECKYCGFPRMAKTAKKIKSMWAMGNGDYSWTYETTIPHATFDIMEDGKKFCRGIVFSTQDL